MEKNLIIPLFFGRINMGDPPSDILSFQGTPSWTVLSTYFFKTSSCALGTGYNFAWYGLASGCRYISTGLVIQIPRVLTNSNLHLFNKF